MKSGYARVSTKRQGTDGNSLEAQRDVLLAHGAEIIYEEVFTGTKNERPELNRLLQDLQSGDELIVTKFDRVARSAWQGMELIQGLLDKGVTVHVVNMGILDNSPTGRLLRNVMLCFAEFERDMIVERTQEGKEVARQREDYREGRPKKYGKKQLEHAVTLLETNTYKEVSQLTGISVSSLIRAKQVALAKNMINIG